MGHNNKRLVFRIRFKDPQGANKTAFVTAKDGKRAAKKLKSKGTIISVTKKA